MSFWFAALLACGPKDPPVALAATSPDDHEAECPSTPPTGYAVYRGEATGADEGAAIAAAREVARTRLVSAACTGVSPARCEAITREIKPWKAGFYDARSRFACASVAIDQATLGSLRSDQAAFDAGIAALAAGVVDAAGGAPVWVADPRWTSGCGTGAMGSAVAGLLINEVTRRGAAMSAGGAGALRVDTELSPGSARLVLSARATRAGAPDAIGLPGFDFAADLFPSADRGPDTCYGDDAMGLSDASRPGARGLTVTVSVATDHGVLCEGAVAEPVVTVSRPADVHVYSVARDGRALHVWPPPGAPARVDGRLSLGQSRAIAQPTLGDERLVAVALDPGAPAGRSGGWTGFCKVDGAFSSSLYPEGAAVSATTFSVIPADAPVPGVTCPAVPDLAALRSTLFEPPICP